MSDDAWFRCSFPLTDVVGRERDITEKGSTEGLLGAFKGLDQRNCPSAVIAWTIPSATTTIKSVEKGTEERAADNRGEGSEGGALVARGATGPDKGLQWGFSAALQTKRLANEGNAGKGHREST